MKAMLEMTARIIDQKGNDRAPCCPLCEQVLNLHQPDESLPSQLLGTCNSCLRWYFLFCIGEESNRFLMLDLPDKSTIEAAGLYKRHDDQE